MKEVPIHLSSPCFRRFSVATPVGKEYNFLPILLGRFSGWVTQLSTFTDVTLYRMVTQWPQNKFDHRDDILVPDSSCPHWSLVKIMNITLENKNNQCPSKPICHQTVDVICVSDYEPAPTHTSSTYYQISVECLSNSLTHTDKNKYAVIISCQH